MADRTITAANSVFMLTIPSLFPAPQRLQGYSADAAFETEDVEPAETVMGVDGYMSVGFVPVPTMMSVHIMPDSPSSDIFESWLQANKVAREVYIANGVIVLPGSQKAYSLTRGVISRISQIPSVRRVLQARSFRLTWADVSPAPYVIPA